MIQISVQKLVPSLAFLIFLTFSISGYSQIGQKEYVNQQMQKGIMQLKDGDYVAANETFREVLKINAVLPTDLSYYFAKTLYELNQLSDSKNFIDKYLNITGKTGRFYNEALALDKQLKLKANGIETCHRCNIYGKRYVTCHNCLGDSTITETCYYCLGDSISSCQKCYGSGVLYSRGSFNEVLYATCDRCDGHGHHTCSVCEGTRVLDNTCPVCFGTGVEASDLTCDHTDVDENHHHFGELKKYENLLKSNAKSDFPIPIGLPK